MWDEDHRLFTRAGIDTLNDVPGPLAPLPPNGTRLLFLLDHTTAPARPTAHATVTDLLTGQDEPITPDPLGVAVPRVQ